MPGAIPQLNAFLLCDQAFQQMPTGKWCVIGTFGVIFAREFPVTYAPFTIFLCLSDFTGNSLVQVNIRDAEGSVVKALRAQIPPIPMSGSFVLARIARMRSGPSGFLPGWLRVANIVPTRR